MRKPLTLQKLRLSECWLYRSQMTEAKGRPTPKRKDAEKARATPRLAPATNRGEKKAQKLASRQARVLARQAFMRGEENALPPRDRGPVRRFVRNYVDARRSIGEFFLPIVMLVLFLTVIPIAWVQFASIMLMYSALLFSVVDGIFLTRKIKKEVTRRFPNEPTKGLGMYGWLRSTQIRRLRAPQPQVKAGEQI
jgi:hypothetical protein